jgi:hypothetical protein
MKPAIFVAYWAVLICLAYTLVLGTAAYAYARVRSTPPLWVAIVVGVLAAAPFFNQLWRGDRLGAEAFIVPAAAAVCAIVTASVFWRVALARPVPR